MNVLSFGKGEKIIPIPKISAVQEMEALENGSLLSRAVSYTQPTAWFQWREGTGQPEKTALRTTSPVSFDDIEVTRELATSKDGTRVPLNIVRRKGTKLNGNNPTLLYGYGGYGISLSPSFDFARRLWFDRGGIYVVANIHGGGAFGEEWHKQGNLTNKQNVFDDFAAAAKHLIERKYMRPEKLALMGGRNGGLLMGEMITQHPRLMRAVVASVAIFDMLRVELAPNGAFNVTEFGTVKDPEQFKALYAYLPYHHVEDGTKYPAVLMLTGANDGRVAPYHSHLLSLENDRRNLERVRDIDLYGLPKDYIRYAGRHGQRPSASSSGWGPDRTGVLERDLTWIVLATIARIERAIEVKKSR